MKKVLPLFLLLMSTLPVSTSAQAALYVTIVQGLGGEALFDASFTGQRHQLREAAMTMTDESLVTVFSGDDATRDALLSHFSAQAGTMADDDRAAIYLVGHGSYDGEQYKFNIPGPDITAADIAGIMASLPGSSHFLVNTSSTSGAMLDSLDLESNIVITATRNGNEKNATEFGEFFANALSSSEADINKNNNISIQEAFDFAERGVADFFESQGKLATEHPQIRGENAASFSLARVEPVETSDEDPRINQLLSRRLELEADIEAHQLRRNEFSNVDYIERLQALILESAEVNEEIEMLREASSD